jgi:two-component system, NarL family, sensor kinase
MDALSPVQPPRPWSDKLRSPFVQVAVAGVVGMVVIGVGSLVASQEAGEAEAMNDVRSRTESLARTVLEPNLSTRLLDGDPDAVARLDEIVRDRVLDGSTLRVKLWDATGLVVYSDEARLIGERYELDDDKTASLWSGEVVSQVSSLEGPENRFETIEGQALEVYLPVQGPSDEPLLFESYYSMSAVDASSARIRSEFAPIALGALFVMQTMHFGLAWGLNRRLRRGQVERERLLQRAIESSLLERRRIAADLHDGVVQDLAGMSYAIAAAAETASRTSPELANDLRSASVGTRRSLQSLRSLLVDIYPPNLRSQGLEAALVDLLAPAATMGIRTDLSVSGEVDRSLQTTALVYRVVQEAVRNVYRHAKASALSVSVESDSWLTVATVVDDGCGFDSSNGSPDGHFGLRLLFDLVDDAGARLTVESATGTGTLCDCPRRPSPAGDAPRRTRLGGECPGAALRCDLDNAPTAMSQWSTQWPMVYPRATGHWTVRHGDHWGVLDPESGQVERVEPSNDRRLPGLSAASSEGQLCGYRVGRRAIVATPTSFIKVVRPGRVDEVVRRHEFLCDGDAGVASPRVRSVTTDGRIELSIMGGISLHRRIRTDPARSVADVAAVVVALHRQRVASWLVMRQPDAPESWVALSGRSPTAHYASIERVSHQLPTLDGRADVVVHGDLHDKNVFCDGSQVSLIDLDGLALGAREDDVANLAVHLELRNLQGRTGLPVGARTAELYCAYERLESLDLERLTAVEAHTWFRLACLYQYRAASQWLVPTLLDLATRPRSEW